MLLCRFVHILSAMWQDVDEGYIDMTESEALAEWLCRWLCMTDMIAGSAAQDVITDMVVEFAI